MFETHTQTHRQTMQLTDLDQPSEKEKKKKVNAIVVRNNMKKPFRIIYKKVDQKYGLEKFLFACSFIVLVVPLYQ